MLNSKVRPLASASGRSVVTTSLSDALAGDRLGVELDLARLDLGQVEQVVDQRQQVPGAGLDGLELVFLIRRSAGPAVASAACR